MNYFNKNGFYIYVDFYLITMLIFSWLKSTIIPMLNEDIHL
jgi:hypothetical protein